MSFIDMMGNDNWSDTDITNRVRNLIRSQVTPEDELKAARLARQSVLSDIDQHFVTAVDTWIANCIEQGQMARTDMKILEQVFHVEQAARRLTRPIVEPEYGEAGELLNGIELELDQHERTNAQQIVDNVPDNISYWVNLRKNNI